jgi:NADPH:quinone reductase-like Zn-dependent oxidoreductase
LGKSNVALHIPPSLSFEKAASLGAGLTTIGLCLYKSLQLPLPTSPAKEPYPVFVYGGSTATGIIAIQFLKLYGFASQMESQGFTNLPQVRPNGAHGMQSSQF